MTSGGRERMAMCEKDKIIIDVRSCPVEDDEKIIELLNKL